MAYRPSGSCPGRGTGACKSASSSARTSAASRQPPPDIPRLPYVPCCIAASPAIRNAFRCRRQFSLCPGEQRVEMHDLVVDDGANSHATGILETHQSHYNVLCLSALEADRTERLLAHLARRVSIRDAVTCAGEWPARCGRACTAFQILRTFSGFERIEHRIGERRNRTGRAGLARALGAERIGRRRHAAIDQRDRRQGGARAA